MQQLACQYLIELAFSEIVSGILKTLFDNTYQWYYRFRIKLWNRILCLSMDYSKSGVLFHHFELSNPKNIIHACFFFASSLTKSFSFFKYHNPELVLHKLNFNFYLIRLYIYFWFKTSINICSVWFQVAIFATPHAGILMLLTTMQEMS